MTVTFLCYRYMTGCPREMAEVLPADFLSTCFSLYTRERQVTSLHVSVLEFGSDSGQGLDMTQAP